MNLVFVVKHFQVRPHVAQGNWRKQADGTILCDTVQVGWALTMDIHGNGLTFVIPMDDKPVFEFGDQLEVVVRKKQVAATPQIGG